MGPRSSLTLSTAAVLATGAFGWVWARPLAGPYWPGASVAAAALAALLTAFWRSRAGAARRREAALTAYAEREIAKAAEVARRRPLVNRPHLRRGRPVR
jgi:hypothetical protein